MHSCIFLLQRSFDFHICFCSDVQGYQEVALVQLKCGSKFALTLTMCVGRLKNVIFQDPPKSSSKFTFSMGLGYFRCDFFRILQEGYPGSTDSRHFRQTPPAGCDRAE